LTLVEQLADALLQRRDDAAQLLAVLDLDCAQATVELQLVRR
jgi:hypothetical protein